MNKKQLLEGVDLYRHDHDITIAEFARLASIDIRRMQKYCKGDLELKDEDAVKISMLLRLPYEAETKPTKATKKKIGEVQDVIGVRGDAKLLAQIYKEAMGLETDTEAATLLIIKGFKTILKEAAE